MDAIESRFQACISSILEHEGGLTIDKGDPGGITKWGISLRFLKATGLDLNGDGIINSEDVIGISKDGAEEVYRTYWWDKYNYAEFNELIVVEKVFDLAVNMGGLAAHKLLQIAINRLNEKPIPVDGILGERTFAAANSMDGIQLRQQLRDCAEHHYLAILAANPAMEWAKDGWLRRAAW